MTWRCSMRSTTGVQGSMARPRHVHFRCQRARVCVHAYKSPKPYNAPKPYSAPEAGDIRSKKLVPTQSSSSSNRTTNTFWEYKAPGGYGSPPGYQSPVNYHAPAAYGPGQSGGGGPRAPRGGGGGGGGGGDGGGSFPRTLTFLFALLVAAGGVMAWKKKGSSASLKASSAISATLLIAAALMTGPYNTAGLGLALGANLALAAYMARGFINTRKPFPQGVLTAFSIFNSLVYIKSLTGI